MQKMHRGGLRMRLTIGALLAGTLFAGAALADPGYVSDPSISGARELAGVWQRTNYSPELRPADGSALPFTDEGREMFAENAKDLKKTDRAMSRCVPLGNPRNLLSPYPFVTVQAPGRVTTLFERNRSFITAYMDGKHLDPTVWDPSFTGDAIASWEGDELVVDIVNTNGESWLDDTGVPTSDQLHTIERWKKLPDGKLQVTVAIEDPAIFSKAWTAAPITYAAKPDLYVHDDWVCDEPHRLVADVPGAARYFPDARK